MMIIKFIRTSRLEITEIKNNLIIMCDSSFIKIEELFCLLVIILLQIFFCIIDTKYKLLLSVMM